MEDDYAQEAKSSFLAAVLNKLEQRHFAKRDGVDTFACTLIFTTTHLDRVLIGHLGDGCAFQVNEGRSEVVSWPDRVGFASQTYFVTSANTLQHFRMIAFVQDEPSSFLLAVGGGFKARDSGEVSS